MSSNVPTEAEIERTILDFMHSIQIDISDPKDPRYESDLPDGHPKKNSHETYKLVKVRNTIHENYHKNDELK